LHGIGITLVRRSVIVGERRREDDFLLLLSRAMENCPLSVTRNCPLLG